MKKSSLTVNDPSIGFLIDHHHYFGPTGVIEYFKRKYFVDMNANMAVGCHMLMMQYIQILYSAMMYSAEGDLFQKLRVYTLLQEIDRYVCIVKKLADLRRLRASEFHILMSVSVRKLQILKKLRLFNYCSKLREDTLADLYADFSSIKYLANEESRNGTSSSLTDLGPNNFALLIAESLLYELFSDDILELNDAPNIKERVWLYAMHFEKTMDRNTAQIVYMLFKSIRKHKEASDVAERVHKLDNQMARLC